jgi:hypothetical protein
MYSFAHDHVEIHDELKWCMICTYGIYIPYVTSSCRKFFDIMEERKVKVSIVVGNNHKRETKKRISAITSVFNNIEIRLVDNMHAKCILFSDGLFITGSMNINDSKYTEIGMSKFLDDKEFTDVALWISSIL